MGPASKAINRIEHLRGGRKVEVAEQTERGKFPPGAAETTDTRGAPQFQGQQSQDYPRDDHKYDRANIGGGPGDDIPAKPTP
ncbi:hypothetical protein AB8B02_05835 [Tardiphaga sp. 862_B3_N4_1]|uniref:hypothetical protein n=1 Tax=Tardiphaga sp. 862_B3_N4_1 TaxID=3240764 RepID=UPI003F263EC7